MINFQLQVLFKTQIFSLQKLCYFFLVLVLELLLQWDYNSESIQLFLQAELVNTNEPAAPASLGDIYDMEGDVLFHFP